MVEIFYPDGTVMYRGNIRDGQYHGQGKVYYNDATLQYEGQFNEGIWEGFGKEYNRNGVLVFEGKRVRGKLNGNGKAYYNDGTLQFEGQFRDNQYEGQGKEYDQRGHLLYEGQFRGNKYDGRGKTYDMHGMRYDGMFRNNKYDGYGKLYNRNGLLQYEGEFREGTYDGNGKLYDGGKTIMFEGQFSKGEYTSSETSVTRKATNEEEPEIYLSNEENEKTDSLNSTIEKKSLSTLLEELESMIGLQSVKKDIDSLTNLLRVQKMREEQGIKVGSISLHLVFTGNPGTGKTTVARLIAQIYREIGFLSKGHLVEVDRSGLVAGYIGQTALKVKDVVNKAKGGVLFIDEAYSLYQDSDRDFGKEAIDALMKLMEDNRRNLVVIVAGYEGLMDKFLRSNPGLKSRFNHFIHFEDYSHFELLQIFSYFCAKEAYKLNEKARSRLNELFLDIILDKGENFANGRLVRNLFEKLKVYQSNRIVTIKNITVDDLMTITEHDIAMFLDNHELQKLMN